jgi:phosphoribosylglycinamide formyltransferase-1
LQNLLDRIAAGRLQAEVVVVLSSRADAGGVERAGRAGIPTVVVPRKDYPNADAFNDALHSALSAHAFDFVILAGFLSPFQLRGQPVGRVLNIHPALIPAFCGKGFYGLRVHRAVIDAGVKVSGCTIHFADDEYDHGPIILQGVVPVLDDDTPERLAGRVQRLESQLYPTAIELLVDGRLHIDGRRVRITAAPPTRAHRPVA